jgi:hypothetical protein
MKGKAKEIALWRRDMSLGGVLGRVARCYKDLRAAFEVAVKIGIKVFRMHKK